MNPDYSLRKSTPTPAQRGNVRKADSYREAFTRIELAMDDGYFLEAIAILESIIADRIASYLSAVGCRPEDPHPSLERLLEVWRKCDVDRSYELRRRTPQGLVTERSYDDLAGDVEVWRVRVDDALHSFVASPSGSPTEPVEAFLARIRGDARMGRTLCDAVIGWHRKHSRPPRESGIELDENESGEVMEGEMQSPESQAPPPAVPLPPDVPAEPEPPLGSSDPGPGPITES